MLSRCLPMLVAVFLVLGADATARAQSAADLQAAAQAFQEGQRAQMRGEFAQAAEMFDLANHSAPSAAALRSAIRMHTSAGHHAAAATRAAHALATYPADAPTVELANQVIAGCGTLTGHLVITCEPDCAITIAGRVVSSRTTRSEIYVDPGVHTIRASWGTHTLERQVTASAGSQESLSFAEADAHTSAEPVVEPATDEPTEGPTTEPTVTPVGGAGSETNDGGSSGLSPVVFAIAAGLTLAAGGAALGVGLDMLSMRDAYERMPTEAGYRQGVERETITNALLGTSIGLAVTTVVLAILTDWDGDAPSGDTASLLRHLQLSASPEGASAKLTLSF
jgi:hypothetical protein